MATATKVCFGGPVAWEKLGISLSTGHIGSKIWRWSTESNGETGFKPDRLKIEDIIDQKTDQKHVRDFTPRMEIETTKRFRRVKLVGICSSRETCTLSRRKHENWSRQERQWDHQQRLSISLTREVRGYHHKLWGFQHWWQMMTDRIIHKHIYVCM